MLKKVAGNFPWDFLRFLLYSALFWLGTIMIRANYNDVSRGHPKWWFSKGNPLISGKSRLVKYYNLPRNDGAYSQDLLQLFLMTLLAKRFQ